MEHGVKESKELLTGAFAVTELLIERFSDGVGVDDAVAIFDKLKNDEDFKAKISALLARKSNFTCNFIYQTKRFLP